jgi:hypothetical protein
MSEDRRPTAAGLTERQRKSIVAAIASGVTIADLKRSRRFGAVSDDTIARIAAEAGVTSPWQRREKARRKG